MITTLEGQLQAGKYKFALVCSRFNDLVTNRLLEGALDCLRRHGAKEQNVQIVWVPGGFELPMVARKLALGKKFSAVICLGAVVRGATPHFEFIAHELTKGIAQTALETGVPVIHGIITADTLEQALERAGSKSGNRGFLAAMNAIEMADLAGQL
jgi:6,7-dimethyl-8-ribityllumazine synthase